MGVPGLKSNDTRRWQKGPHLRCSLEHIDRIFDYLRKKRIGMYRFSSDLAPYATHPDMPQFHSMVAESAAELRAIGRRARELDLRLSFHPSQFVLINSPDPALTQKSVWDLASQAEMLDRMELGPEAVLVTHVGGVYGDRAESRARWAKAWPALPEHVRRRLVLEHDDIRFSAADILWIHEHTGVRLVFDYQHFWCLNPERLEMLPTLRRILATWPETVRPKLHFSSPRTELREVVRAVKPAQAGAGAKRARKGEAEMTKAVVKPKARKKTVLLPPIWTGHADFTNPFEFARFMEDAAGLEFDVMLEGKAKDISLLKLRPDLLRYAPGVAARFGIFADETAALEAEEAALQTTHDPAGDEDVDEAA
ncbi:MAG: UV DNA damage repair endonuclease UvsE [Acetobacteraceae bacterium]|nr:UV DNA damage repair endonuclease UvsE [Acetobacteraceae bacterium]